MQFFFQESITKEDILKGDIPRTPFLAFIVPFGKTIHDAETYYVVVEGQVKLFRLILLLKNYKILLVFLGLNANLTKI
jgi:hypothetical protein